MPALKPQEVIWNLNQIDVHVDWHIMDDDGVLLLCCILDQNGVEEPFSDERLVEQYPYKTQVNL